MYLHTAKVTEERVLGLLLLSLVILSKAQKGIEESLALVRCAWFWS